MNAHGSPTPFTSEKDAREALKRLIVDEPDLERLEDALSDFNVFEAIGEVKRELRHSNFLRFLLDPGKRHALEVWPKSLRELIA
jgi:hypothetical protein